MLGVGTPKQGIELYRVPYSYFTIQIVVSVFVFVPFITSGVRTEDKGHNLYGEITARRYTIQIALLWALTLRNERPTGLMKHGRRNVKAWQQPKGDLRWALTARCESLPASVGCSPLSPAIPLGCGGGVRLSHRLRFDSSKRGS